MNAEEWLEDTEIPDHVSDIKIEWESVGKPTQHPYIHWVMENYADHKHKDFINQHKNKYSSDADR